jgi:hypothetical protein
VVSRWLGSYLEGESEPRVVTARAPATC